MFHRNAVKTQYYSSSIPITSQNSNKGFNGLKDKQGKETS